MTSQKKMPEFMGYDDVLAEIRGHAVKPHDDLRKILSGDRVEIMYQLDFLSHLVNRDYHQQLDTLKSFGFYDHERESYRDAGHPGFDDVRKLLEQKVNPAQAEVVRMMRRPVFQLVPVTNYDRYTDIFTNHRSLTELGWIAKPWDNYDGNSERNNWRKISRWDLAVTDDCDEPLPGDPVNAPLKERIDWFKSKFEKYGIEGMDFRRYMGLAMNQMGADVDPLYMKADSSTLLNGVPEFEDKVVVGTMQQDVGGVVLRRVDPSMVIPGVNLKPSLVIRPGQA